MIEMVPDKYVFNAISQWGPRPESAEELATRWLALIERLQTIDPLFSKWTHWETGSGFVPFDPRFEAQVSRVLGGTTQTRDGRLFPRAGTRIWTTTDPCPRPKRFKVQMGAGRGYTSNYVMGGTDPLVMPDPDLVSFGLFRGVLLATAETFEARQARVYPTDLRRFWSYTRGISEELDLAWISYVAPRFAHLVEPPASAIVERRPDGGLLMAATAETFSTENADHLDAARAIKAALGAYNAIPWTAETGK